MSFAMHRQPSVSAHNFAMVPRADVPRSKFRMRTSHKTAFSASRLIPIYLQEVLPGDTFSVDMTAFVRLATPVFPVMDNLELSSFFFFVPNRLVWSNWERFCGYQHNPGESTAYTIPQIVSPVGGFARNEIYDYFGLPCTGQVAGGNTISINALPLRGYNLIWNEWFRDQNHFSSTPENTGNGPDTSTDYSLQRRMKRHDYFTSALPWLQKGTAVTLPLTGNAPVKTAATAQVTGAQSELTWLTTAGATPTASKPLVIGSSGGTSRQDTGGAYTAGATGMYPSNLYADLAAVTSTTINALRQSFQIQKLLERDARGGTRYTEVVRAHFGVVSPDARLQRPEYLGGGTSPVDVQPVAQTGQTGLTGGATPLATLSGVGAALARHGFSQSFTEHGYIIGLACVRADLTYQQGIRRLWSRSTRYDFYWPVFAHLGEQAILSRELYADGSAADNDVFGYQERWAEYRYHPGQVTGVFNSRATTPLDAWHYAQNFATRPTLNYQFMWDDTRTILSRNIAAGAGAVEQQFLCDAFFDCVAVRPLPMYSVPGLIDHF